jgi:hypothetical protein
MKSEEGVTTKEQKAFLRVVLEEGYCAVIVEGVDAARKTIAWYIGISDHEPASVIKMAHTCQVRSGVNNYFVKVWVPARVTYAQARKRSVRNCHSHR